MKKICNCSILLFIFLFVFSTFGVHAESSNIENKKQIDSQNLNSNVLYQYFQMDTNYNPSSTKTTRDIYTYTVKQSDNIHLATWTYSNPDHYQLATLIDIAKDYEKNHPGFIVLGGVNAEGYYENEPTNAFIQDGDVIRKDVSYEGFKELIGFKKDGSVVIKQVPISSEYLKLKINNKSFDITRINELPEENGVALLTVDLMQKLNLEEYHIFEGTYDLYRKSSKFPDPRGSLSGTNYGIFIKGIVDKEVYIDEINRVDTKKFYLVTNNQDIISNIILGQEMKCQFDYLDEFSDVVSMTGYMYKYLEDGVTIPASYIDTNDVGEKVIYDCAYYSSVSKQRCGIGFKEDGTIVLLTANTNKGGPTQYEVGEIFKELGCKNAYQFDGGGSVSFIKRDEDGKLEMLNTPGDGTPRSIMSGLFIVARDPAVESKLGKATPTTITIERKEDEYSQSVENLTVKVDGKTYPMTGKEITIEGLKENTTYDVEISYEIEGEECKSSIKAQTKAYYAGLNFIPRSHGFIVEKYQTDEVLRTVSASIQVGEKVYEMGDVERYEIEGLLKNASYEISYKYVVENQQTKERYEKESEGETYQTLSYEIPEIESFEIDRKTSNKISIKYGYTDIDKIVKEAYIQMNEEIRKIGTTSGIETFEGINTYKEGYEFKLVIKYEDESGRKYEIESEKIEVEKEACEHEYDNECDEECNRCGEKREAPHRWEEASCEEAKRCRRCGKTEGEALGHDWEEATYEKPKECTRCGKTEGEALKRPGEPAEEKGCKKCSKTKVISMLTWIGLFSGAIVLLRKKK